MKIFLAEYIKVKQPCLGNYAGKCTSDLYLLLSAVFAIASKKV